MAIYGCARVGTHVMVIKMIDPWLMDKLTVIQIDDWALLFKNEELVDQNHDISVWDLERHAQSNPFFLEVISAYETELDKKISADGDCSMSMKLSEAMSLMKKTNQ
jgi:hypothetical protein